MAKDASGPKKESRRLSRDKRPPGTAPAHPPPPAHTQPRGVYLRVGWPLAALLALLTLAPWVLVGHLYRYSHPAKTVAAGAATAPLAVETSAPTIQQGSWGRLEVSEMMLEPRRAHFFQDPPLERFRRWRFKRSTLDRARERLSEVGLDDATIEALIPSARPDPEINGVTLYPPDDVARRLTVDQRAALYPIVQDNFFFYLGSFDQWFASSRLPADLLATLRGLVYPHGNALCFADLHLVLPGIHDPFQRIRLQQVLCRVPTYRVQVHVAEGQPIDGLVNHWDRAGQRPDVETLLQALQARPGGGAVDLVYLLPPFARTRLYTYLNPAAMQDGVKRDCHWTSLNFFNERPDDRFADMETDRAFQDTHLPVKGDMQFGDVIVFIGATDRVVHSCVYLADDLVFTKDGPSLIRPFIIDRLQRVVEFYGAMYGPLETVSLRRRDS